MRPDDPTLAQIVKLYMRSLRTRNMEHVAEYFHPQFMYKYDTKGSGGAVRSPLRYLGYMTIAFAEMKRLKKHIVPEPYSVITKGMKTPCILLKAPHYQGAILVGMAHYIEKVQVNLPENEVLLYIRFKQGKIFRVFVFTDPLKCDPFVVFSNKAYEELGEMEHPQRD